MAYFKFSLKLPKFITYTEKQFVFSPQRSDSGTYLLRVVLKDDNIKPKS